MSKGLGQMITIKFTDKLLEPDFSLSEINSALGKPVTSNQTENSSYPLSRITDGNTATADYASVTGGVLAYAEIDLGEVLPLGAVKVWHYYSDGRTYYDTKTQISEDGVNWITIFDSAVLGTYAETSSGKIHQFEMTNARFIRDYINGSTANTGNHWVEIQCFAFIKLYNPEAFTVSGQEYKYINGPIIDKTYEIVSVKLHPDYLDDKHLLLTTHPQGRFNNALGNLTVAYDHTIGNLRGRGGFVESFSEEFTPTDLVPFSSPNENQGTLTASSSVNLNFPQVYYWNRYMDQTITVAPSCTLDFIHVDDINP